MNRYCAIIVLLSMNYYVTQAQAPTGKGKPAVTPAPPVAGSIVRPYTDPVDTANENKIVALALKGPEFNQSIHQNKISELDLKRAKGTWLNLLSISTNYNDQSFAKPGTNGQAAYVYPKYFFGITIPLGIIFSQGTQVKIAREAVASSKDKQEVLARQIKADVLGKYKQYKLYNTLLQMQVELVNDVLANSAQAEENFKKGSITVESYIAVQKIKNEELAKNMNLQLQQDMVKLEIERIIGVPLDEVIRPSAPVRNIR